jgi:hypothetical protein
MRFALILVASTFVACGGSSSSSTSTPTEAPINLTPSGLSSAAINLPSGGRIHFFNMDTVNHQIASTACPDLDTPVLAPGMDSLRPMLAGPLTCSYDDALNASAMNFDGSVTVNAPGQGGGAGY